MKNQKVGIGLSMKEGNEWIDVMRIRPMAGERGERGEGEKGRGRGERGEGRWGRGKMGERRKGSGRQRWR